MQANVNLSMGIDFGTKISVYIFPQNLMFLKMAPCELP